MSRIVHTDMGCETCGSSRRPRTRPGGVVVFTTAKQDGVGWAAFDGDETRCHFCGDTGMVSGDGESDAWVNWDNDGGAQADRYHLALQLLREEREKVAYLKSRVDEERRHRRRLEAEVHRLHVFSSPSIDGDATSDVTVSIDGKSYRNVARVNRFALRGMTEDGSLWFVLDNQLRALCSSVLSAAMEGASK